MNGSPTTVLRGDSSAVICTGRQSSCNLRRNMSAMRLSLRLMNRLHLCVSPFQTFLNNKNPLLYSTSQCMCATAISAAGAIVHRQNASHHSL